MNIESIKSFYKEYFDNVSRNLEYSKKLTDKSFSKDEYLNLLRLKSSDNEQSYNYDEEMLNKYLRVYIKNPSLLTYDIANVILECAENALKQGKTDGELTYDIIDPLIHFYESQNDITKLISCYYVKACTSFYLNPSFTREEYLKWNEKLSSFLDKYFVIEDEEARLHLLTGLYNQVAVELYFKDCDVEKVVTLSEELNKYLDDQRIIGLLDRKNAFSEMKWANKNCIASLARKIEMQHSISQDYKLLILEKAKETEQLYKNGLATQVKITTLQRELAEFNLGLFTKEEMLDELVSLTKFSVQLNEDYHDSLDLMLEFLPLVINFTDDRVVLNRVRETILTFIKSLPYDDNDFKTPFMIFEYVIPFISSFKDDKTVTSIMDITTFREFTLTAHSIMVSKIATMITQEILKNKRELLEEYMTFRNISDDKMLTIVSECGLYHDIGEANCTNIIGIKTRKITPFEFEIIKEHPQLGAEAVKNCKNKFDYFDIVLGHHKFNNGIGGYPVDFNNTQLINKVLIDIVSISDTIEASTDYIGRIYNKTRTLQEILGEMKELSPERYNPEIIDFITGDKLLQSKLQKLVKDDRLTEYYNAHLSYQTRK